MKGEYWTCPTISDEGYDILVTGRADIENSAPTLASASA